ncbi:MAG: hypothetical protein L0J70_01685, partial [Corynebacterium sp.]|nr:hypothetical protein [Corynebacterium sp.]
FGPRVPWKGRIRHVARGRCRAAIDARQDATYDSGNPPPLSTLRGPMKKTTLTTLALAAAAALCACTPSARDSEQAQDATTQDATASGENDTSGTDEDAAPRDGDAPVLGASDADGACDPGVIDIDHEKNTPHVTYHGKPGDTVDITYVENDGTTTDTTFELEVTATTYSTGAEIFNGDLDRIEVSASGTTSTPGNCVIGIS